MASERIEHELGEEYVERFRKEVIAEEKLSPEEKQKLEAEKQHKKEERKRIREETKEERVESPSRGYERSVQENLKCL